MEIKPASELMPQVEMLLSAVSSKIAQLLPEAEFHHIGATAIPGALTKGDVDVLARVPQAKFLEAVEVLRPHFEVKQPTNWSPEFAGFGDDSGFALPLGVQVVVCNSNSDFFLYLRDYLIENRDALERYNQLKLTHACDGADAYWSAKDAFFEEILAASPYRNQA